MKERRGKSDKCRAARDEGWVSGTDAKGAEEGWLDGKHYLEVGKTGAYTREHP
jgi:hypothetical protein